MQSVDRRDCGAAVSQTQRAKRGPGKGRARVVSDRPCYHLDPFVGASAGGSFRPPRIIWQESLEQRRPQLRVSLPGDRRPAPGRAAPLPRATRNEDRPGAITGSGSGLLGGNRAATVMGGGPVLLCGPAPAAEHDGVLGVGAVAGYGLAPLGGPRVLMGPVSRSSQVTAPPSPRGTGVKCARARFPGLRGDSTTEGWGRVIPPSSATQVYRLGHGRPLAISDELNQRSILECSATLSDR